MDQEDRPKREGLQRTERIVRTGEQVRHLPQGVEMGDAVNRKFRYIAVDLSSQYFGTPSKIEQGPPQTLARLGVRVRGRLRGQGPANQRVVGEVHGSTQFIASGDRQERSGTPP